MQDGRIPKKIRNSLPEGRRPAGRPRARWEENVDEDARGLLGIRNWKSVAADRSMWRRKLEEARAQSGL